jgi:anti-sigma factor RsiW
MNHEQAAGLIDAYLDEELDAAAYAALAEHLGECSACAHALSERRALLQRLRDPALRFPLPPALAARFASLAAGTPSRAAAPRPVALRFFALAASVLLAIGVFYVGERSGSSRELGEELVTAHVRALVGSHELDVVSSDHHTVKPWFNGKLSFSPPVPELGSTAYRLLGGRIEYLGQMRIAVLVYQAGAHHIDVFVWPRDALAAPAAQAAALEGYHLLSATAADMRAVFVSDLAAPELASFRERWLTEAR